VKSYLVPIEAVDTFWPAVSQDITACLEAIDADCCTADLYLLCRQGNAFLILFFEENRILAAKIMRAETWPSGVVLNDIVTVGKNMKQWLPVAVEAVTELARRCGAKRVKFAGRKGWARVFKSARVHSTNFIMEV
jgi:hypothetical protein